MEFKLHNHPKNYLAQAIAGAVKENFNQDVP
jgi:hypothetical protein